MNENPVRLGYVGAGFVAQTIHLPNFAALPGCDLVALAEVRPELGQSVARRFGIENVYSSHEALAQNPDIEAVAVSGPYALQGRIAHDLLKAGKHVFMEKPMAVSVERAEALVASQTDKARLMVGYMKRYDTGNVLLKKHLDEWRASGEAGELIFARNHGFCGNWTYAKDPNVVFETSPMDAPPSPDDCPAWLPEGQKNSYLGYLQQWTHNFNLLRYFLDGGTGQTVVKSVQLDSDGSTGLVVVEINGTRAVVESAGTSFHGWEEHTQIYFRGGWLKTAAPPLMQKEVPATVEMYRAGKGDRAPQKIEEYAPVGWSYREEARHFIESVRSGAPFRSSAQDTLEDVKLLEEIYRQFLKI